jgi:hypothetical protein
MARYPHLVDIAWDIVEKLVFDWVQKSHFFVGTV